MDRQGFRLLVLVVFFQTCFGLKNVLFLIASDLRPEIGAYYSTVSQFYPFMHTPNIDALAAKSLLMKNAHVQYANCGPSRSSFMTGRRPDTTGVYNNNDYWRTVGGPFETIPEHFKLNGYNTAGFGKVFYGGSSSGDDDDAQSWTETYFRGSKTFESKENSWHAINASSLVNDRLVDEQIADEAIASLQTLAQEAINGTANFFVAVGFRRPNLPFVFPDDVMSMYYPEASITLPSNPYVPANMPSIAWSSWGALRRYDDIGALGVNGNRNNTLPDANVLELRRAYYSSITWVDEQLGRVVDEIQNLGLENDTIISLISDNGFLLGEHGGWCKNSLFELATRVPMMIHIPGLTDGGIVSYELAELVDVFPTVVEAAGLDPLSLCPENSSTITNCTEGLSLLPLTTNPCMGLKNASFSQQVRKKEVMGYSIRTQRYRYTEWIDFDFSTNTPDWTALRDQELYDLTADFEQNFNVVSDSGYSGVVSELSAALQSGWRNAII